MADQDAETGTISLAVTGGSPLIRTALASLLTEAGAIDVVATTSGGEDTVSAAAGHRPDVILYHATASDNSDATVALIGALRTAAPGSRVVILADTDAPDEAIDALLAGASGYVLQSEDPADLIRAVLRASVDSPWISPQVTRAIVAAERSGANGLLSEREQQIVKLIALGHTNSEIGEQLHLSVRTIESHRARVLRKLELSTRAELVSYAITSGLFDTTKLSLSS